MTAMNRSGNTLYPHALEDLVTAVLLDFPEPRAYFIKRLSPEDFQSRHNRTIFFALRDMTEPVSISTVHQHLCENGWAAMGIAEHLAALSSLGWQLDREDGKL
mgnify:CR=1 FL=1